MCRKDRRIDMAKKKGPKKPKTEFSLKRIERKQTRHLSPAALAEWNAKKAASAPQKPQPAKA